MKKILLGILTITLLWSCSNQNITIEGAIKDAKDQKIFLSKLNPDGSEIIDSVKLNSKGAFKFKTSTDFPQLYTLSLSNGNIITTVAQAEDKLFFKGNAKDFARNYTVKGSDDAVKAKLLSSKLFETKDSLDVLYKEYSKDNSIVTRRKIIDIINKQRRFSSEFIINNGTSLAAYIALYQKIDNNTYTLNENKDIYYIRIVASSLKALYPESQYTKAIMANLSNMSKALANARLREAIKNAPKSLPEIDLPDVNNKNIKLSSFKGKYIILDFTNLANESSIAINNTYKKVYKKYKRKGLVIYQVGLDKNYLLWKEIVKKQGITWKNVWDKNSTNGLAIRNWNIQSIPTNFIINTKYEIVGKNQYGRNLEDKLEELIK